ncbi:MAG: hypothetical protein WAX80_02815 [Minisyncoccia bacterium]
MSRRINFSHDQLALPFGDLPAGRQRRGGVAISHDSRVRIFWALLSLSIIFFFVYIYAINMTTRNIVARQNLERQIAEVSGKLSSLEFVFIGLKNDVTVELAHRYGFQEVRNPLYVSRTPKASLSFNTLNR